MKKVHWKTRQAIVRDYEQRMRIVVTREAKTLLDVNLHDLHLAAGVKCGATILKIELDQFGRLRVPWP